MKIGTQFTLVAALAAALIVASSTAHAHGRGGPCLKDLEALCPSVTPGPGGFRDCIETLCPQVTPGPEGFGTCLQQHQDQLSAECKDHLSKMQAKMAEWHQACGGDVQTFCSDVSGPRGVFKCLHEHKDELSQACQDLLAQHHHHHHHWHKPNPTPAS